MATRVVRSFEYSSSSEASELLYSIHPSTSISEGLHGDIMQVHTYVRWSTVKELVLQYGLIIKVWPHFVLDICMYLCL